MATAKSWQTAEVPGPKKALVISKPEVVVAMIKRSKRPILIVGHKAVEVEMEEKKLIDYMIQIASSMKIPVVATAHTIKEFLERGFKKAFHMPIVDITNRLQDPDWKGLDGRGQYDLVLIVGIPYYMEWLVLSSLKHFSKSKTISLERFYQPNATWSFPNISIEEWIKSLNKIVSDLEVK